MDQPIQTLVYKLKGRYPALKVSLDAPTLPTGEWFLDIVFQQNSMVVQWHPSHGFGMSIAEEGYGEGPSEVYQSIDAVFGRLISIFDERAPFVQHKPREYLSLGMLRKKMASPRSRWQIHFR